MTARFLPALLLSTALLHAQAPAPATHIPSVPPTTAPTQPDPATLTLNVLVTDRAGHPVSNLPQTDFVVQTNGQTLPVLSFQAPGQPAANPSEILIVLDAVNVGTTAIDFEREQVVRFLRSDGGRLRVPISIVLFTDASLTAPPAPTQDGNTLAAALAKQPIALREIRRSSGFWGADERFSLSVDALERLLTYESPRPGHKLILWISPGWPYLSGPGVELSNKQQNRIFQSIVDISRLLQQADVTLSTIDPLGVGDAGGLRTIYYRTFLKGITKPSQTDLADISLQVLATHSGGRVNFGNNDVGKVLAQAVDQASGFYTLTVPRRPADAAAGQPETYHALDLKLDRPGLLATTTTGFYTTLAPPR